MHGIIKVNGNEFIFKCKKKCELILHAYPRWCYAYRALQKINYLLSPAKNNYSTRETLQPFRREMTFSKTNTILSLVARYTFSPEWGNTTWSNFLVKTKHSPTIIRTHNPIVWDLTTEPTMILLYFFAIKLSQEWISLIIQRIK